MKEQKLVFTTLRQETTASFFDDPSIDKTLSRYTKEIDLLIISLWNKQAWPHNIALCLIATGGYGRQELFPYADIDIALLYRDTLEKSVLSSIETFIAAAWDYGLKIHSTVRSLDESIVQAHQDHTSYSSLLESRFLAGNKILYERLVTLLYEENAYPLEEFFISKKAERTRRHARYHDTNYNLEPDIKNSPGGLRDIHILQWFSQRCFHSFDFTTLRKSGFISEEEYDVLSNARSFLLTTRFVLHFLAHRAEDRLLFDYQLKLAEFFEVSGETPNEKVEVFMQRFFTVTHQISVFSDIILALFDIKKPLPREEVANTQCERVREKSSSLFELFASYAENPTITSIPPETLRAILRANPLIDDSFRADAKNTRIFLRILHSSRVFETLSLMSHYGVLGAYIPDFSLITRKMQYDLFHAYTVDAHTLFVIRNLERFVHSEKESVFPLCFSIMQKIAKPDLLYLAALFHDIGKGRKESHSVAGARLATLFCEALQLHEEEIALIAWLVKNHLLLSKTAQQKDLNDPEVIQTFSKMVGTVFRLNHLYLLTVADIHATNEKLWNSWRASLLEELYVKTHRFLSEKTETPTILSKKKKEVSKEFLHLNLSFSEKKVLKSFLQEMNEDYFLQYTPSEIEEHYQLIAAMGLDSSIIDIKQHRLKSATEIFIYTHYDEALFCRIASTLSNLRFTIVEATIHRAGIFCLSTYVILEHNYTPIVRKDRLERLQKRLETQLCSETLPALTGWHKRQPSAIRFKTQVIFSDFEEKGYTMMTLLTRDRPGLLAHIGKLLLQHKIALQKAKISTLGDRVEDLFYLTSGTSNKLLTAEQKENLEKAFFNNSLLTSL